MAKKQYFQLIEGNSSKFWHIEINGDEHTSSYGRIGTAGQSTTKSFSDAAKAKTDGEKLIQAKTRKGYQEVSATEGKKHQQVDPTTSSKRSGAKGKTTKAVSKKAVSKKAVSKKASRAKETVKKSGTKSSSTPSSKIDLLKMLAKKAGGANQREIKEDLKRPTPKLTTENILKLAGKWDAFDVIQALLDDGLDINAAIKKIDATRGGYGDFCSRNARITRLLIERGLKGSTVSDFWLNLVASNGPADVLELLLSIGAKYKCKTNSLLKSAIENKKLEVVKLLIAHGNDIDQPAEKDGDSPLNTACYEGNGTIAEMLIAAGANVNFVGQYGATPLHRVVHGKEADRVKIARLLIDRGADVNARQKHGRTVLQIAADNCSVELIQLLLKHGAEVNAQSNSGETPLISAAHSKRDDVIRCLLEHGADLNARYSDKVHADFRGKNALEIARYSKAHKAVKILEEAMLDGGKAAAKSPAKNAEKLTVKQSWKRIEAWLKSHHPDRLKSLNKPATAKQIADAEKKMKIKFPADVKESYKIHNGQSYTSSLFKPDDDFAGDYYLLPLSEVVNEWKVWTDLVESGEFEDQSSAGDSGIKSDQWFNPKWIPIASNGGGDSYCLDLDPAKGGKAGQVITMNHEVDTRSLLASSFAELLSQLTSDLESGVIEFDE
jgi:cell wall assembly regulator SMI1/ankyrin repeat protein/predicted DNA-binding WGR domain protein